MPVASQIKIVEAETISCSCPRQKVARIASSGYIDMKRKNKTFHPHIHKSKTETKSPITYQGVCFTLVVSIRSPVRLRLSTPLCESRFVPCFGTATSIHAKSSPGPALNSTKVQQMKNKNRKGSSPFTLTGL